MSSANLPLRPSAINGRRNVQSQASAIEHRLSGTSDAAKTCVSHTAAVWASTLFLTSLAYLVSIFPTTCAEESWWMEGKGGAVFRMAGDALSHCPLPPPPSSPPFRIR